MRLLEKKDYPDWLKKANIENEIIYIDEYNQIHWVDGIWNGGTWYGGTWESGDWLDGYWINGTWKDGNWQGGTWQGGIWQYGTWYGGTWQYGTWESGTWKGGIWYNGTWKDGNWQGGTWIYGTWQYGTWYGGTWESGLWKGGLWKGGLWKGGTWQNGHWLGGTWKDPIITDRLLYMASLIGIVFDENGYAKAYRTTRSDHTGRYTHSYVQKEGYFEEPNAAPSGSGTCWSGIHVSSIPTAVNYFGVDPYAVLWEVTFKRENLLDCDGEKARINAGYAKIVKCPFL